MRLQNFSFDRRRRASSRFQIMNNRSRRDLFLLVVILWAAAGCWCSNFHATAAVCGCIFGGRKKGTHKRITISDNAARVFTPLYSASRKEIPEILPFCSIYDLIYIYFSICPRHLPSPDYSVRRLILDLCISFWPRFGPRRSPSHSLSPNRISK